MDVIFLFSTEIDASKNLERLRSVVGARAQVVKIDAKGLNKSDAYRAVIQSQTDLDALFVFVEGDNFVLDEFTSVLDVSVPTKFTAVSPFGQVYAHGSVKVVTARLLQEALNRAKTGWDISTQIEFVEHSSLVVSEHRFNETPLKEFKVIAKEIIKLHFWGHSSQIDVWRSDPVASRIVDTVSQNIDRFNLGVLVDDSTLNAVLDDLYFTKHQRIAVLGICRNEERHISSFVKALKGIDQIIILDTGSTDATISILKEENVEVHTANFDSVDFSAFRNHLTSLVDQEQYDYFVWLDIDERLGALDTSIDDLRVELANAPMFVGSFDLPRFDISGSQFYPMNRVFKSGNLPTWRFPIHEQPLCTNHNKIQLKSTIFHLESEQIQEEKKYHRYRELIFANFLTAEANNDFLALCHYLFFYIDIIVKECNTAEVERIFKTYVCGEQEFEFPQWFLLSLMFYFVWSGRDDHCQTILNVALTKYPSSVPSLVTAYDKSRKFLVSDATLRTEPNKSQFVGQNVKFKTASEKLELIIDLEKPSTSVETYVDAKLIPHLRDYCGLQVQRGKSEREKIVIQFSDDQEFFQFFGNGICQVNFSKLSVLCIADKIQKKMYFKRIKG